MYESVTATPTNRDEGATHSLNTAIFIWGDVWGEGVFYAAVTK